MNKIFSSNTIAHPQDVYCKTLWFGCHKNRQLYTKNYFGAFYLRATCSSTCTNFTYLKFDIHALNFFGLIDSRKSRNEGHTNMKGFTVLSVSDQKSFNHSYRNIVTFYANYGRHLTIRYWTVTKFIVHCVNINICHDKSTKINLSHHGTSTIPR